MDTIKFACDVSVIDATDVPLNVSVLLNNQEKLTAAVSKNTKLEVDIPDIKNTKYKLDLVISGKTDSHTVLDQSGNVVSSTLLVFNNFEIDEVGISNVILANSLPYTHNFNGNGQTTTDIFYDVAGFNGTISLEFFTPFYVWLLENT